uniref:GNAT family N-acetyltransferase n=1 Tax=Streptomyces asoensis TaxID=249586 RepID=UPI0034612540
MCSTSPSSPRPPADRRSPRARRPWREVEPVVIAEVDGERAGCVFLVADDQPGVAKLRVLLVTPGVRGLGLDTRLVEESPTFAREPATSA